MARLSLNALQAVLIRERLILYLQHRRAGDGQFSVRKLVEAIAFSEANANNPAAYNEERDSEGESVRYDSGFSLKNSTISNFLDRKASAIADENLPLIRNFLVHEGFLSPALLKLGGRHPEPWLSPEFSGLAPTDARLQKYRYELEGEYLRSEGEGAHTQLWIAAPGRSKPFVTVRIQTVCAKDKALPSLKCISLDGGPPSPAYEGRIFLMPGRTLVLVEVCSTERTWDGRVMRLTPQESGLIVAQTGDNASSRVDRLSHQRCAAADHARYSVRDGVISSHGLSRKDVEGRRPSFGKFSRADLESARDFYKRGARERAAFNAQLIASVRAGDARAVLQALLQGADPNSSEEKTGRMGLHLAAASNRLDIIEILTANRIEELLRIGKLDLALDEQALDAWRRSRLALNALVKDRAERCYPSAYAPVGFDDTERNRTAMSIWRRLMRLEMNADPGIEYRGRYAHLEYWKPSSVMRRAMAETA